MSARLTIFSDNLKHNFRLLEQQCGKASVATVVKANAYGLGFENVVPALAQAGCRTFFVNRIEEGITVRGLTDAEIFVLDTFIGTDTPDDYKKHGLIPVFSSIGALSRFPDETNIAVRFDIGFNLAGIDAREKQTVLSALSGRNVFFLMAHLSCSEQPQNEKNEKQLALFSEYAALFPQARKSLCASYGVALGERYRFDLIRAGASVYGASVLPGALPAAKLSARVGWLRHFEAGESLGYNDGTILKKSVLAACLLTGAEDGIVHKPGCFADYRGTLLPIIAPPTTNYLAVDASAVADCIRVQDEVDLFNLSYTPDRLAADAGMDVGADVLIRLKESLPRTAI